MAGAIVLFETLRKTTRIDEVDIYLKMTGTGPTSIPVLDAAASRGVASIAAYAVAGVYTLTLEDHYYALENIDFVIEHTALVGISAIVSDSDVTDTEAKTVGIILGEGTTPVNLPDGAVLKMILRLRQRSRVNP